MSRGIRVWPRRSGDDSWNGENSDGYRIRQYPALTIGQESRQACYTGGSRREKREVPVYSMLGHMKTFRMLKLLRFALSILVVLPRLVVSDEPVNLGKANYDPKLGVIMVQINWGRSWKCGPFENAQLQGLTFTKQPFNVSESVSLKLGTPSKLFVDNEFLPYAYVVQPGDYTLTAFDVKVARTRTEVAHIQGSQDDLIKDGKSVAGSFTVNQGEIVYVGHFGLDCSAEPFLWRYYVEGRAEFERYVAGFRETYPFVKQVPVHFRLFSTQLFGNPYSLEDAIVK